MSGRHVLLAASLVAHFLVIGWLLIPAPIEQVRYLPQYVTLDLATLRPSRQPCTTLWLEHQDGCVVTRKQICKGSASSLGEGWVIVKPVDD